MEEEYSAEDKQDNFVHEFEMLFENTIRKVANKKQFLYIRQYIRLGF